MNIRDMEEDSSARTFSESAEARIAEIKRAADQVHDAYISESKKLYREDGQKKFSEAEHQELADDLKRQRDEAFSKLKKRADKASSEITEKLEVAALPERYLSDQDMERANSRRGFVQEDIDRLPLGEVPVLLREAELSGDRVEKWLASRYATIRADRELEKLRESGGAGVGAEEVSRHLREVREGAQRLQEQLQLPGARVRKQKLEALRRDAAGLKSHVLDRGLTHEERVALSSSPFTRGRSEGRGILREPRLSRCISNATAPASRIGYNSATVT